MTKVTQQRTYDKAPIANTDAAKQLDPFIDYVNSFSELVIRILLNGVSFGDNFSCLERELELKHDTPQTVGVSKPVTGVLVTRPSFERDVQMTQPLHWYYDDQNNLTVLAKFTPVPAVAIKVKVVLLF
jgi:hypothetical protein